MNRDNAKGDKMKYEPTSSNITKLCKKLDTCKGGHVKNKCVARLKLCNFLHSYEGLCYLFHKQFFTYLIYIHKKEGCGLILSQIIDPVPNPRKTYETM
jgi:hypothetical protein